MTDLQNPPRGNNPARPEISPVRASRLRWMLARFGDAGALPELICTLALGEPIEGEAE
jgi:hypothetical protein